MENRGKVIDELIRILRDIYPHIDEKQSTYSTRIDALYILHELKRIGFSYGE